MSMFWKKKEDEAFPIGTEEIGSVERFGGDKAISGRQCHRHLENLFENRESGVAMKLYIENFKRLNDLFGYEYCEELLEHILEYLEEKASCPIYRYIGVEFVVVLRNSSTGKATHLAEEIIEKFEAGWKIGEVSCSTSIQIGICSFPGYASDADQLLKCLDLATTKAAEQGANQYAVYDSALHNQYARRQCIARNLEAALAGNEIEVRYRPTYNVKKERFTRAEFYMRIFIKNVGMVGSSEFIPIAEDTGQIRAVEYYALNQVAALIGRLTKEGKEFESIALALSPMLLLQEDFLDEVARVIETYEIPEGKLAIEIGEYAMSLSYLNITTLMQELEAMGVELILNDFGSGYFGISQIYELPVSTLKFERLFIWQLETSSHAEPIIEGLSQIAVKLGKNLIAEGVETEGQIKSLTRAGCDLQQGFYYSATLPEDILVEILDCSLEESNQVLNREKETMKR